MKSPKLRGLNQFLPLTTARLTLRPFRLTDADSLFALHSDPNVTRYAGGLKTRAESDEILHRLVDRLATTGFGLLAVEEKGSGLVIGWCGVQQMRHLDGYEVIYALQYGHWGQGLAFEAAQPVVESAFRISDVLVDSIFGLVFPQNTRSIRVLEKLGMSYIKTVLDVDTSKEASLYEVGRSGFLNQSSSSK